MKGAFASALFLVLAACASEGDSFIPGEADIGRVEARLSSHPCVGSLDQWERNYRYGMSKRFFWPQSDHPNLDVIEFHLRRAGTVAIAAKRASYPAGSEDWPDSSSIRSIDGSYVISSGRLSVGPCKRG